MSYEIESETGDFNLRLEGDYVAGSKPYYNWSYGNFLPGEGPDVNNFKVYIVDENGGKDVEITHLLKQKTINSYKASFIDYHEE